MLEAMQRYKAATTERSVCIVIFNYWHLIISMYGCLLFGVLTQTFDKMVILIGISYDKVK